MTYYVTGYYQGKAILKKDGQLFFVECEEAKAPTGTLLEGESARSIAELSKQEQLEIHQIYAR